MKLYHDDPLSYELYRLYRSGAGLKQGEAMLVEVLEAELKDVTDPRERSALRFSKIQEVEQNFRRVVQEKQTARGEYDSNLDLEVDMFFANAREYCYMLDMNEAQKRSVG